MFGWANIRNQNLFVGVLGGEIFFFGFEKSLIIKVILFIDILALVTYFYIYYTKSWQYLLDKNLNINKVMI
ncbi:hypothetical protein B0A68_03195 [Flavobacterium reichenbachii]|uniref:Uncharacterized protein n=1 Tax=Flavobacterium reichenbachii TaxID=362418 RepID=A0A085ZMG0_9FLAO|nr:hypothetical protein IW19_08885 [Flavobacterium reichenbachii]OXB17956.1 hypothetical protein B0A68_03195 [Flavobacterium reichenbachii]